MIAMLAKDLNEEIKCPICDGEGEDPVQGVCPECSGDGITPQQTMGGSMEPQNCETCNGSGRIPTDCRRCDGAGSINRYGPENHSERFSGNIVVLAEEISDVTNALHVESMPISNKKRGGFNERYGDKIIEDISVSPVSGYVMDMKDRVQNQLGENSEDGAYQMPSKSPYNGTTLSVEDMPNKEWPQDADFSIGEVVAWINARGDEYTSSLFVELNKDLGFEEQEVLESIING